MNYSRHFTRVSSTTLPSITQSLAKPSNKQEKHIRWPSCFLCCWSNSDKLRDTARGSDSFKQFLRQSCSVATNVTGVLEVSLNNTRYINSCFTCLLIRWRSGWSLCAYSYNVLCS